MDKKYELPIVVGGVRFKNPFFVASGPTTKSVEQLLKIEECGWAAASIKLSIDPDPYVNRYPRYSVLEDRNALTFTAEKRLTFSQGLTLVRDAKKVLNDLILFANITYAGDKGIDGWVNMAVEFEKAGADIIELNMCCPNMSFNMQLTAGDKNASKIETGASLGQNGQAIAEIVKAIKKSIKIPLFVKLTPEGGKIAEIAKLLYESGADAVGSTANRLGIPTINLDDPGKACYHLQDEISMSCHCGSWLKPLAQRDTYEIRKLVGKQPRIAATGGITNAKDAIEMVMCGGDLLGICAETLIRGYDFIGDVILEMKEFMQSHGYQSLESMRDVVVPMVKSAPELTIYKGYAKIKNPRLSAPCKIACPLHVPVQAYIKKIAERKYKEAYELITTNNPMQSVCGYICNHKCEDACIRGHMGRPLQVKNLKRFITDMADREGWTPKTISAAERSEKVAVMGSGAAGLSCAYMLTQAGYKVTVFEKEKELGGVIRYALPAYAMPRKIIDEEIKLIKSMGVSFQTEREFGRDFTAETLKEEGYSAIFLATGASAQAKDSIENSDIAYSAIEFLKDINSGKLQQVADTVIIAGNGYPAVYSARSALRLGAKQVMIVHSGEESSFALPKDQLQEAKAEGVKILTNTVLVSAQGSNGKVTGVQLANVSTAEHTYTIPCDMVINALNYECGDSFGTEKVKGLIKTDKRTMATSIQNVYAGGAVAGAASFVAAVAAGKRAAASIDKLIAGETSILVYDQPMAVSGRDEVLTRTGYLKDKAPVSMISLNPDQRIQGFEPYIRAMSEEEAVEEASRCLKCGCGEGCQKCRGLCCEFAIDVQETDIIHINSDKCVACGMCYRMCPNKNIEIVDLKIKI